jgi:NAD(P)-dependent dehydrogenase (short-subunit alcohol dehydrogenase family)
MDLTGKVALVTGAAHRLGRAIALTLSRAGADITLHYGRSEDAAKGTASEIDALGRRVELLQCDLRDPDAIETMFARVRDRFGKLDVLVNSAGVYYPTPIDELSADQWDSIHAVNARAPALCIRHATPLMSEGGAIVNISDVAATKGWGGYPAYCASKAALEGLTRSAAKALAPRNIRVNAVAPGIAMWSEQDSEESRKAVLAQVPMKRPGTPDDIANAVRFLATADYITGQVLRVDGAWHTG